MERRHVMGIRVPQKVTQLNVVVGMLWSYSKENHLFTQDKVFPKAPMYLLKVLCTSKGI